MTLTKKQIDNILSWIGKSYPVDIEPPNGIIIDVLTIDFIVVETKIENFDLKKVVAWRHKTHGE